MPALQTQPPSLKAGCRPPSGPPLQPPPSCSALWTAASFLPVALSGPLVRHKSKMQRPGFWNSWIPLGHGAPQVLLVLRILQGHPQPSRPTATGVTPTPASYIHSQMWSLPKPLGVMTLVPGPTLSTSSLRSKRGRIGACPPTPCTPLQGTLCSDGCHQLQHTSGS